MRVVYVHKNKKPSKESEGGGAEAGAMPQGPGSGGVTRGRGDAPMAWGSASEGDESKFQAQVLDPARSLDAEHSAITGISAGAPKADPRGESAGNVAVSASSGKATWRRRLSPHHREAVRTYFSGSPEAGTKK
ncbi:MAG: hypothetical protein JNJ88_17835 [Planctomycetes bacterium]|nr:hypothetical protein [Planctomycetota bacterium]